MEGRSMAIATTLPAWLSGAQRLQRPRQSAAISPVPCTEILGRSYQQGLRCAS